MKGFLEAEKAEQIVGKELPPSPIKKWKLLRINLFDVSLSLDFN